MKWIKGKDVSVYLVLNSPSDLELIGCARTCTRNTIVEVLPKSTLGSGLWKEFKAISNSWNITIEGLATVGENMDMQTLLGLQFGLNELLISWQEVTTSGTITYAGYGIITNVTTTGNYADVETYNVEIQGTGELSTD